LKALIKAKIGGHSMDITIGDEQIFRLLPMVDMKMARKKAEDKKTVVFGSGLSALISRLRAKDLHISYSECRYEPFWRVVCQVHYEYERKQNYIVPVIASEVQHVTINGMEYPVANKPHQFTIEGVEHCVEEASTDVIYDAVRSQQRDWKSYLRYDKEIVVDMAEFAPNGSIVAPPEMHASAAVRQALPLILRTIQADTIHEIKIDIQTIALYFRPVYAFEYKWGTKGKTAVVEFDGLTGEMTACGFDGFTGEMTACGVTLRQQDKKVITRDLVFDLAMLSAMLSANLLMPGSGIVVSRKAKAVVEYHGREPELEYHGREPE
jgi:hypothetical protein